MPSVMNLADGLILEEKTKKIFKVMCIDWI